jgi:hypothetical protein
MNPNRPNLKQLRFSGPDTAILYGLLEHGIYVYGQARSVPG